MFKRLLHDLAVIPHRLYLGLGQYGILKRYEINSFGVYLDKDLKAEKPLCHFHTEKDYWTLRFAVNEDSGTPGGLTLFGSKFGDYPQDIYVCVRYE